MFSFYDKLKDTFYSLDVGARARQVGNTSNGHKKNEIVDFFQYAPKDDDRDKRTVRNTQKYPTYYTPFSWTDGKDSIKGMVVSGLSSDGQRILGVELEDGRSLNSTGAKNFFETLKSRGAFDFAEEQNLWQNKENGDLWWQPGNPFDFYKRDNSTYSTVDNNGYGTFRVAPERYKDAGESTQRLGDAMNFFKNLRAAEEERKKGW